VLFAYSGTTMSQSSEARQRSAEAAPPANAKHDGPAELPRVYMKTSLADTPAPGKTVYLKAGEDLQRALDKAGCGDTLRLQEGTIFRGRFMLPAKNCDNAHWIVIRTSAPDSNLPPEGTRITPCYAGVTSLAGRPSFHCQKATNVMVKLEASGNSGALVLADRANHYRLVGLEITRPQGSGPVSSLVQPPQPTASAHHIIFDRVWAHGTAHDETARGILLEGGNYAVVDSFLSDFHCTAVSGACIDSQAITGGVGVGTVGPYKISNNFLEASGENIMFGGSRATATPADIEIRHNYLFKPMLWRGGQTDFIGGSDGNPFIVKNHFELKNGQRVLFEGNVLENSWGGFSQPGASILLTPKNQAGGNGQNLCPTCQVSDITIRYCRIDHVGSGFQIGIGRSDNGGAPLAGGRYSIHDVILSDIDAAAYGGYGYLALLFTAFNGPVPALEHVTIDHVTAFPSTQILNLGGPVSPKMSNFTFTNSIVSAGMAPIPFTPTGGGQANCAARERDPASILRSCFSSYMFAKNAIIGAQSVDWPASNFLLRDASAVHFVRYGDGKNGDYRLMPDSKYKKAGLDGKDLGADINALRQATAGVE
jgi:hypothetical protein